MTTQNDTGGVEGMPGDVTAHYRFLHGADMAPGAVLAAYPGARFLARARTAADDEPIWGIVIELPAPASDAGEPLEVVTDDGRPLRALAVSERQPADTPAAVLAAARYWELPPPYVQRLAELAGDTADADTG